MPTGLRAPHATPKTVSRSDRPQGLQIFQQPIPMNPESTSPIEPELELVPSSALEAITRADTDVQITTAKKYPRSIELFKRRGIEMATIDEQTAESCLYARPVGKDFDTGKQKIAEGMSVRM